MSRSTIEQGPSEVVGRRVPVGPAPRGEFTYCIIETSPSPTTGVERRGDQRRPTRLRDGVLAERRGRPLAECRIRDRSRLGARLWLDKDRPLPPAFLLTDAASHALFWATLVWQAGRDAGVRLRPLDERC